MVILYSLWQDCKTRCLFVFAGLQDSGKQLLIKVFYGGAIPADLENGKQFLIQLERASIYFRWMAISLLPDVFATFNKPDSEKKNPDASVLSYLYCIAEDRILSAWSDFLMELKPTHLSLHYDGVRVSKPRDKSVDSLCCHAQERIKRTTGFDVKIREKQHLTILQDLRLNASSVRETSRVAKTSNLCQAGNCIPAAVALLLDNVAQIEELVSSDSRREGCRSYADCEKLLKIHFAPMPAADLSCLETGDYVLHLEHQGKPHCVAMSVTVPGRVVVQDVPQTFELEVSTLKTIMTRAVDRCVSMVFRLHTRGEANLQHDLWSEAALQTLLTLQAGGVNEIVVEESSEALQLLLDVEAGSSASLCDPIEVMSEDEGPESIISSASETEAALHGCWLDEQAQVLTDRQLLESMKQEIEEFLAAGASPHVEQTKHGLRCPFCPWRCFIRPQKVLHHVRRHHRSQRQYCCSGTKQLKLILALHDADMIAGVHKQDYLRASANHLRQRLVCNKMHVKRRTRASCFTDLRQVKPALSHKRNSIDKHLRLFFAASGYATLHLVTGKFT